MKISYLLFLVTISCTQNNNSSEADSTLADTSNLIEETSLIAKGDSSIFKKQVATSSKLFILNDDGTLNIDSIGINISLKKNKNDKYDLQIYKNEKSIFSEKDVAGISKIFIHDKFLMFSIFSFFSEDGANEGNAIAYDYAKNEVRLNNTKLSNTCNPVLLNEQFYMIDNLRLIEADRNFNFIRDIPIHYKANSADYLDTFLICSLNVGKKDLLISFSSHKSLKPCAEYKGSIGFRSKKIILQD